MPRTRRRPGQTDGRPTVCTPETTEKIVTAVKLGLSIAKSVQAGGITRPTFLAWQERAHEELARRANGTAPDIAEQPFIEFLEALHQAEVEGEQELLRRIHQAGTPTKVRTVTVKREVLKDGNRIVRNRAGDPVFVETTTISETEEYDWRADLEVLKRRYRNDWSDRTEITGAGGAPIRMEIPVQNADEAALREFRAAMEEAGLMEPATTSEESADEAATTG